MARSTLARRAPNAFWALRPRKRDGALRPRLHGGYGLDISAGDAARESRAQVGIQRFLARRSPLPGRPVDPLRSPIGGDRRVLGRQPADSTARRRPPANTPGRTTGRLRRVPRGLGLAAGGSPAGPD